MANRTLFLNVKAVDDEQYYAVKSSIDRYRAGCRQLFSVVAAAVAAGSSIQVHDNDIRLKPNSRSSTLILREMFHLAPDAKAKAFAYPARRWWLDHVYPGALSFVWDAARRQVVSRWQAKDPEFARASRGWLILQGARGVAEFQRVGIEFPQATGRPQLLPRGVRLNWDRDIGPVEFKFADRVLSRYEWGLWNQIRDGERKPGTVTLGLRDHEFKLYVPYEIPEASTVLDVERVLRVSVHEATQVINLVGPDGERTFESLTVADAVGRLNVLAAQTELWEARKSGAGNPRKPWGFKKAWRATVEHLRRVTVNRERFQMDWHHAWTRRIAARAASWQCGTVEFDPPEGLCGHPWGWARFKGIMAYKLKDVGSHLAGFDEEDDAVAATPTGPTPPAATTTTQPDAE